MRPTRRHSPIPMPTTARPPGHRTVSTSPLAPCATSADQRDEIYVMDPDGSNQTQLTHEGNNTSPVWSPDGKHIAYITYSAPSAVYAIDPDGSNQQQIAMGGSDTVDKVAWSPD